VLGVNVEEKATGQLALSGGYSSLEKFVVQLAVSQNNFMGKGQELNASVNWSRYAKSVELGFVEPYFLDKSILLGGSIYRRDYRSFNFDANGDRNTTYSQTSTGGGLRLGFPVTEFTSFATRYSLVQDKISLDKSSFYTDPDGAGPQEAQCDPLKAGRYLCDEIGTRITSLLGYSVVYDNTDGIRPTRGQRLILSQDFAGLGGDVRYVRSRLDATKYRGFGAGWVASAHAEGGYIQALQKSPGPGRDAIRLTDRFFGPQLRGFDIRGIGPRIQRVGYNTDGSLDFSNARITDAVGGRAYYMGRLELEFPVTSGLKSVGLRPSAFLDIGSLWMIKQPILTDILKVCSLQDTAGTVLATQTIAGGAANTSCTQFNTGTETRYSDAHSSPGVKEFFRGDSPKPRVSIGIGVNWTSPFGPLRIDLAKALLKQKGDDTKLFSFNVGTQF
jgi:outer membrane protein insertion porin family